MTTQLELDISPDSPNSAAWTQVTFPISNGITSLVDIVPVTQILHSADVGTAVTVGKNVVVGWNVMVGPIVDGAVTVTGGGAVVLLVVVVGVSGGSIVTVGVSALILVGAMVGESKVTPTSVGVGRATTPGVGTIVVGADIVGDDPDGESGICIVGN